ncbi:MAG TPA: guanylate kinase [Synergistales bacterium]|nr:guanylate kinase [Synergistales bacterium]
MTSRKGNLFIISGPSGAGKGTLRERLFRQVRDLAFSISCTTRPPRQGEEDGVDYRFVDEQTFQKLMKAGQFLEWAYVHDHYYGTLKEDVLHEMNRGKDVVLEIDVQGAIQVKQACPGAILIFVAPPSLDELEKRLRNRGTEEEKDLEIRLRNARDEIITSGSYDHMITNDDVERASCELQGIVLSYRDDHKQGNVEGME